MKLPLLRHDISLRGRLVIAVVTLTAIALVITDITATVILRDNLINRIDTQLRAVAGGPTLRLDQMHLTDQIDDSVPTPSGTVRTRRVPNAITLTLLDPTGKVVRQIGGSAINSELGRALTGITIAQAAVHLNRPWTISSESSSGYRIISRVIVNNEGTAIVAVSLADLHKTLINLDVLLFALALLVLLLLTLIARKAVSIGLRPLDDVEKTAAAIASGDLSARLANEDPKTEVGRLNSALNAMLERIEVSFNARKASEDRLRRFAADASHELRTPLTAIRGFAELHRQGAVSGEEATTTVLRRIEKESVRMSTLVDDLLLLARLDQQRPLAHEPVDIGSLIEEAVEAARVSSAEQSIDLAMPDEDIFVHGDAGRLHQAVSNLLVNARTHTPAGTPIHVRVDLEATEVIITVADEGPGLTPEQSERIFERFYRADPSRKRGTAREEGSGLGLSIVDAVVTAHGGSVSADCTEGVGAIFTIRLPRLAEDV
jgi:two-component system OmpR family sensor kinase